MQQRVSVLPAGTEPELTALLRFYLKQDLADPELLKLARLGIGSTPAMVEGWVKEAKAVDRVVGFGHLLHSSSATRVTPPLAWNQQFVLRIGSGKPTSGFTENRGTPTSGFLASSRGGPIAASVVNDAIEPGIEPPERILMFRTSGRIRWLDWSEPSR